jgi:hypothetical protein
MGASVQQENKLMLKYLIPTILISTGAVAQEATPFMSYQNCGSFQVLADETAKYQEKMLFTGSILQQHISRQPVKGQMAFTVNQDTGSWTLVHLFPNGVACMVANGSDFEPYTD